MTTYTVPKGHTVHNITLNNGDLQYVYGTADNTTIDGGGNQYVEKGGT